MILLGKCIHGELLIRATMAVVDFLTDWTACEQYGSTDNHSQKDVGQCNILGNMLAYTVIMEILAFVSNLRLKETAKIKSSKFI